MFRCLAVCLALLVPDVALAAPLAKDLFAAKKAPSHQQSQPIGSYSRGCGAGMVELPESGPTWQAMRLSRNRNWGQPVLVDYLEGLSAAARKIGWAGLYIGDMSQPRGGPMNSGHASHQIGLDADIWMLPATRLNLTRREREQISSVSVRTSNQLGVNRNWSVAHYRLLRAAASDSRVDRIFVAAAIKVELCRSARSSDTAWLQKIRPWTGHDSHFHVRLKCPRGARACQTQTPNVAELSKGGNGCAEAAAWIEALRNPPKRTSPPPPPEPPRRGARQFTMADLPKQCASVLASD